jgi:hypothetical protein
VTSVQRCCYSLSQHTQTLSLVIMSAPTDDGSAEGGIAAESATEYRVPEVVPKNEHNEVIESPKLIKAGLSEMREGLAAGSPLLVLPHAVESDEFCMAFLRARKYDIPRTIVLVRNCDRFCAENRDLFMDPPITAEGVRPVVESGVIESFTHAHDRLGRPVSFILYVCASVSRVWVMGVGACGG